VAWFGLQVAALAMITVFSLATCGSDDDAPPPPPPPAPVACGADTFSASDGGALNVDYDAATGSLTSTGLCMIDPRADLQPAPVTSVPSTYTQYRISDVNAAMVDRWTIVVMSQAIVSATGPGVDFVVDGSFATDTAYFERGTGDWTVNYCIATGGTVHVSRNDAVVGGVISGTFSNVGIVSWTILSGAPGCPTLPLSGSFSITIK